MPLKYENNLANQPADSRSNKNNKMGWDKIHGKTGSNSINRKPFNLEYIFLQHVVFHFLTPRIAYTIKCYIRCVSAPCNVATAQEDTAYSFENFLMFRNRLQIKTTNHKTVEQTRRSITLRRARAISISDTQKMG